ncbi:MAG: helix-turn-helix transcriptional regulator [Clostridia bacterium]|nr:helix-turn-helix transcriptional regulator [Clostridia bacterium]
MTILGNRLKELRIEHKLQQTELADKFGISQSAVTSYERGVREPNCDLLVKFADYYDVSLDYLLGRTDKRINRDSKELSDLINNQPITFNGNLLNDTGKRRILDICIGLFWHDKSNFESK